MGSAEGEGTGDFLGAEMYWSSWSAEQNLALVTGAGFEVISAEEVAEEEHGEPVTFLWVVARTPGSRDPLRGAGPTSGGGRGGT